MKDLDVGIDQLIELMAEVRRVSYADDKTKLENGLALRRIAASFGNDRVEFDAIAFGDLNGFKSLNDMHGHQAGDIALEQVGDIIYAEFVLSSDIGAKAYRMSGDEFVLLLKHEFIETFIEKVKLFESVKFTYEGKEIEARMSFGLAIWDEEADFNELQKRAETACISAKSIGDGVCVRWTEDVQRQSLVDKRRKCAGCGSINKCSVPIERSTENLKCCSFCEVHF